MGFSKDGSFTPLDSSPDEDRMLTLDQRIEAIRCMTLIAKYIEDAGHSGRSRVRIKPGIVVILENTANRLDDMIWIALEDSKHADEVDHPPRSWLVDAIVPLGESAGTVGALARTFRFARDHIDYFGALLEFLLGMRTLAKVPPYPSQGEESFIVATLLTTSQTGRPY